MLYCREALEIGISHLVLYFPTGLYALDTSRGPSWSAVFRSSVKHVTISHVEKEINVRQSRWHDADKFPPYADVLLVAGLSNEDTLVL